MISNLFKSIFFLPIFLAMPIAVFAQQFATPSIGGTAWIGVRAGANFANETFTAQPNNASTSIAAGAIGGLTVEYWFDNSVSVNLGILYDQKGVGESYAPAASNRQVGNTIYSGSDNFKLSYIEIPILLKYTLGRGTVRPYICAGPSFGNLFQSSETASGSVAPFAPDTLKSYLQSMDISIYAALGVIDQIYHGPILFFEAGFATGISNIYKTAPVHMATDGSTFPDPIDPAGAKSSDIRVTIGAEWQL
jgi:hypothetical protein